MLDVPAKIIVKLKNPRSYKKGRGSAVPPLLAIIALSMSKCIS